MKAKPARSIPVHRSINAGLGAPGMGTVLAAVSNDAFAGAPSAINAHTVEYYMTAAGMSETDAFQAAVDAACNSENDCTVVQLQPRVYELVKTIFLNVDATHMVRVHGAGSHNVTFTTIGAGTILKFTTGIDTPANSTLPGWPMETEIVGIRVRPRIPSTDASSYFELKDLVIHYEGSNGAAIGLKIGQAGVQLDSGRVSLVEDVAIDKFPTGLSVFNARSAHFSRIMATVPTTGAATALSIGNQGLGLATCDLVFDDCWFVGNGPLSGSYCALLATASPGESVGGIHFKNTKFNFGNSCLKLYAVNGGRINDIFINSCQFDNGVGTSNPNVIYGIDASTASSGIINSINISDSWIVNFNQEGVRLNAGGGGIIANCNVTNNYIGLCKTVGAVFVSCRGLNVSNNTFADNGTEAPLGQSQTDWAPIVFAGSCIGFVCEGNTSRIGGGSPPGGLGGGPWATYLVRIESNSPPSSHYVVRHNVGSCTNTTTPVNDNGSAPKDVGVNIGYYVSGSLIF